MIRLRRVLLKNLCLYLSKMTVLIRLLINFPATLHSEHHTSGVPSGSGTVLETH